jgi:hypothetical protein
MRALSTVALIGLSFLAFIGDAAAKEEKPPKIPVAFGKWSGPSAGSFKASMRSTLNKSCVVVGKKKSRAYIEGVVEPENKGAVLHLVVKASKNDEVVESRDFHSPRPTPSSGLGNKIGRAVVEMANRAPVE